MKMIIIMPNTWLKEHFKKNAIASKSSSGGGSYIPKRTWHAKNPVTVSTCMGSRIAKQCRIRNI